MSICCGFLTLIAPNIVGYNSAGVVPIVQSKQKQIALFRANQKPMPVNLPQALSNTTADRTRFLVKEGIILADLGAHAVPSDKKNPAMTAARAFFKFQSQYKSIQELADALLKRGTKIDMGNHITYFMSVDPNKYQGPSSEKLIMLSDLLLAIRTAQNTKQFNSVLCHDPNGVFVLIHNKFAEGLANPTNFSKLKQLNR